MQPVHTIVIRAINRVQLQIQEACPRSGPVDQSVGKQGIMDRDGGESLRETFRVRRTGWQGCSA